MAAMLGSQGPSVAATVGPGDRLWGTIDGMTGLLSPLLPMPMNYAIVTQPTIGY